MFKKFILASVLMVNPMVAESADLNDVISLPVEDVGTYYSEANESLDDFALRIAPILDSYTAKTEFEACGILASDGNGKYGIVLGSSMAGLACVNHVNRVPEGMTPTKYGIHSHPRVKTIKVTEADKVISEYLGRPMTKRVERNGGARGFSPEDFAYSGYLVAGGKVLFQEGYGTVRTVGKFDPESIRKFALR